MIGLGRQALGQQGEGVELFRRTATLLCRYAGELAGFGDRTDLKLASSSVETEFARARLIPRLDSKCHSADGEFVIPGPIFKDQLKQAPVGAAPPRRIGQAALPQYLAEQWVVQLVAFK